MAIQDKVFGLPTSHELHVDAQFCVDDACSSGPSRFELSVAPTQHLLILKLLCP
jgi:hypothetical protein